MKISEIRTWVADQWFAWSIAWQEVWREVGEARQKLNGRQETIEVRLEEYCVLLESRAREMKAYELLGDAQEKIRMMQGAMALYEAIMQRETAEGHKLSQVLIDQKADPGKLVH